MKSEWARSEQRAVEHEREPGERVPVAGVPGRKRPGDVAPSQPAEDVRILRDVKPIVVSD